MRSDDEDTDSLHWVVHPSGAVLAIGGAGFGSPAITLGDFYSIAPGRDSFPCNIRAPSGDSVPAGTPLWLAQISLSLAREFALEKTQVVFRRAGR
jgi:hypothetical protein